MPTYIICGWKKEELSSHEFAHREASRGNSFMQRHYFAQPEEFRFEAEDDNKANRKANEEHPELVERRQLLKVVPPVAESVQSAGSTIEAVMSRSVFESDPRRTPFRATPRF